SAARECVAAMRCFKLQCLNTQGLVEILVEFVVFTDSAFYQRRKLINFTNIYNGINVVEECCVSVHGAQRRRQQYKEQTATLCGPQNVYLAGYKDRSLFHRVKSWIQQNYVQQIFPHAIDSLPCIFSHENFIPIRR